MHEKDNQHYSYASDSRSPSEWQKAVCPVCGRVYLHIPQYKPATCLNRECVLKARQGKVIHYLE